MESGIFLVVWVIVMIFSVAISLAAVAFWIWMLVDVIQNDKDEDGQKVVWILVVVFGSTLGAIVYLAARRQPRRKAEGKTGLW